MAMSTKIGGNRWPYRHKESKDPNAVLDYQIDWTDWLTSGESIRSVEWVIVGATLVASVKTATTAIVWLSGGTVGVTISATCRITTDSEPVSRVDDRTLLITVAEQ